MKAKSQILFVIVLIVVAVLALFAYSHRAIERKQIFTTKPASNIDQTVSGNNTSLALPEQLSLDNRKLLSKDDRLKWLESNGEVPIDADYTDWYLSQKTSWWGKPLDPKTFWKGRVVWEDKSADKEAQRHGRWYPPMPTNDPKYLQFSDKEVVSYSPGGVETANFDFHETYREGVFWDQFSKTQPKPPEELDRQVVSAANEYFHAYSIIKLNPAEAKFFQDSAKSSGGALNYPPEEFTDDALFWAYVMEQRSEYAQYLGTGTPAILQHFFETLRVDPEIVTNPLSADQIKAANAWKIAYLKRLGGENVDQSYINAYLQAWNLSSNDVFGSGN